MCSWMLAYIDLYTSYNLYRLCIESLPSPRRNYSSCFMIWAVTVIFHACIWNKMAGFASEVEGVSSACPATHHKTWKLLQQLFFHVYQYILRCQNTSTGVPSNVIFMGNRVKNGCGLWAWKARWSWAKPKQWHVSCHDVMASRGRLWGLQNELCKRSMGEWCSPLYFYDMSKNVPDDFIKSFINLKSYWTNMMFILCILAPFKMWNEW